jgi:hypothetical protein
MPWRISRQPLGSVSSAANWRSHPKFSAMAMLQSAMHTRQITL